ncbi:MAG: hypothetical protein FWF53_05615 [Candidatus Azobacteroides sp.]|nr:hypothetical protein [Candidatus Azobacteroides sp.]
MNVIYIFGCCCVGKTTLARFIIERNGGAVDFRESFTITKTGVVLAGKYSGVKYGGFDYIKKFKKPQFDFRTVIYEGALIGRINSEKGDYIIENDGICVYMFASIKTIEKRLKQRSNTGVTNHIIKDFKGAYTTAKKYKEAGLRVITLNTDELTTEQCYDKIKQYIHG